MLFGLVKNFRNSKLQNKLYLRALKLQKKTKQKPVDSFAHNMNNISNEHEYYLARNRNDKKRERLV